MDKEKETVAEQPIEKDEDAIELQENETNETSHENSKEADNNEDLQTKLQQAENTAKDYLDRLQRSMAEFDNFRKRTNVEKASMYENGVVSIIEKLLPIHDNFERAISSTSEDEQNSNVFKGVEMIYKQFNELFTSLNIEEISGVGEAFDPNLHNAVLHVEDESLGENVIAEVMQKGYKYKEKVIRPSMVKVAN